MTYTSEYVSPLGTILLAAAEDALIGLWFIGQRYFGRGLPPDAVPGGAPPLAEAARWLDVYFSGREPEFMPPLRCGSTPFSAVVSDIMREIPYGHTVSYGEIAAEAAKRLGVPRMSAQAVGGAVGRNPISILIPCHRVVGANGSLTGYGGGIGRKLWLLKSEGVDVRGRNISRSGTAF